MSREIWKKVFGTIPDEDLVKLIDLWSLQVKGFRQITNDNVHTARLMAIAEALKPKNLKLIKSFYDIASNLEEDDSEESEINIREVEINSLIQHFKDGLDLHIILGALYSSTDKEHHKRAEEFESALLEEYSVTSIMDIKSSIEQKEKLSTKEKKDLNIISETMDWEEKWKKSESKNKELRKTIENLEKKYTEIKKQLKEEKQQWIKEKAQLQQEVGIEKGSSIVAIKERNTAIDEAEKFRREVQKLKSEISHLNALILNSNQETAISKSNNRTNDKENEQFTHVALVGDPKNRLTEESKNPIFHIFAPGDVKEALEKEVFKDFDQIWILTYLIPPQIKRKITKQHTQEVKEFADFPSMKRYIKKVR